MVAIDTLKFDNEMNAFIINTNIVLHYVFSLNIYVYYITKVNSIIINIKIKYIFP